MLSSNLLFRSVSVLLTLILLLTGLFGLIWPWVPGFRHGLIRFLQTDTWVIPLSGGGLLILGLLFLCGVYLASRRTYYHLEMGGNAALVDEQVIEGYLIQYWQSLFGDQEIPTSVTIRKQKIHVTSNLPPVPFAQQRELLKRIETDLGEIFSTVLDYRKEFIFSASFEETV
jgi:hypothetical protein